MLILLHKPGAVAWRALLEGDLPSLLVALLTRSKYGHVAVWFEATGTGYESVPGFGVQGFRLFPKQADVFRVATDDTKAEAFAQSQLGKPYDWSAIAGFLEFARPNTRENRKARGRWICSEFAETVAAEGGVKLLRGDPWAHSPRDISLSTLIAPDNSRRR